MCFDTYCTLLFAYDWYTCDETVFIIPNKEENESATISNDVIMPNFDPPLPSQINDSSNLLPANIHHCKNFMAESLKEQRQQCDAFVEASLSRTNKLCSAVTLPEKSCDKTSASFASIMSKLALKSEKFIHLPAENGSLADEKRSNSEHQQPKTVNGKLLQPTINGDNRLSDHAKCDNQQIGLASLNSEVKNPKPVIATATRMARCSISSSNSSVNSVNTPRGRTVVSKISPSAKQPACSKTSGNPNETKCVAISTINRLKTSPSVSSSLNRAKVSPPNSDTLQKYSVPNGRSENMHSTHTVRKSPSENQSLKKVSPNATSALEKQQKMCDDICKIFRDKLNVDLPSDPTKLGEALSDGVHLCNYLNYLRPKTIKNIHVANGAAGPIPLKLWESEEHDITNYKFYNQDYPVVFNIILWFSVSAIVALLFISVSMWYMDPGRDSIIYRMTMTRAKKD
uniref:Calponin-homology (CH) domain-containing protein n=1 Tax=Romanomermis culicivorax TaxID=13658 RepID=A0A915KXG7_ROMCU